jgi:hypothetical protein
MVLVDGYSIVIADFTVKFFNALNIFYIFKNSWSLIIVVLQKKVFNLSPIFLTRCFAFC